MATCNHKTVSYTDKTHMTRHTLYSVNKSRKKLVFTPGSKNNITQSYIIDRNILQNLNKLENIASWKGKKKY